MIPTTKRRLSLRPAALIAGAVVLSLAGGRSLRAQTPITAVGLGYPVQPVDGRSAALGGAGVGILDGTFSLLNPADLRAHRAPAFALAFTGEGVSIEGDAPVDTGRERFTVIRALAPFGQWAIGIAFGGEFDQDWSARFQDTLVLSDGSVPFEESREHDGGISTIDVSLARSLGPVALGVSAQRLTGSVRQSFNRTFGAPLDGAPQLGATGGTQLVAYRGWRFRAGASVTIQDRFMASGAVSLGSELTAETQGVEERETGTVDLPGRIDIGASARITPDLLIAGSAGWAGWSTVGQVLGAESHDVVWYGGGIEYRGLSFLGGEFPLRVGARQGELPFGPGADPLTERSIGGGFGWVFQNGLAEVSAGFEFGTRGDFEADGLEESFRRVTFSFALRQR